jgi:RNA polymerase primary sigma factor
MCVRKNINPNSKNHENEAVFRLISKGLAEGYVTPKEIRQISTNKSDSKVDLKDFLRILDTYGINVIPEPKRKPHIPISIDGLEKTTDPVRLYLQEMSGIDLLSKKGEVILAKQMEKGRNIVTKALSKTRCVLDKVLSLEKNIKDNPHLIPEFFELDGNIAGKDFQKTKKKILKKIETKALNKLRSSSRIYQLKSFTSQHQE